MRNAWVLVCCSASACVYTPLEILRPEAKAPVAIIDGGPALEVGRSARVMLDGGASYDPDGEPLTFAWSYTGDCAEAAAQRAAEPWRYELVTAGAGTRCQVTLVVADPTGEQGEAEVEVTVVETGAFVAAGAGCVNRADPPEGFLGRGSPSAPWCTLRDGLAAAEAYHLVEVRVSAEPQLDDAPIVVPPGRAVLGGHLLPGWMEDNQAMTPVVLGGDATLRLAPGSGTVLRALNVYRTTGCSTDCALIDGEDASFQLTNSLVGRDPQGGNLLHGEHTARLWTVRAVSRQQPIAVQLTGVTLAMATLGEEIYGLAIDGRGVSATGRVAGCTIEGAEVDTDYGAGVQLLSTDQVTIEDATVTLASIYHSLAMVAGVVDGICGAVAPPKEPCAATTCASSWRPRFSDVHVSVRSELVVSPPDSANVGLALCGSEEAVLESRGPGEASLTVEARTQAVGLLTVETRDVRVQGANGAKLPIVATLGDDAQSSSTTPLAAGWLDGLPELFAQNGELLEHAGGSERPRLAEVELRAALSPERGQAGVLIGAGLFGTRGADGPPVLDGVEVHAAPAAGAPLAIRAVGLWTAATEEVVLEEVGCAPDARVRAEGLAACWLDGEPGDADFGSRNVALRGARFAAVIGDAARLCVLLSGTEEGELSGSVLGCSPSDLEAFPVYQVGTTATWKTIIRGNRIGDGFVTSIGGDFSSWMMVGVRDGGVPGTGADTPGSDELTLERNVFFPGGERFRVVTGVQLLHGSDSSAIEVQGEVRLFDNAVLGYATESWAGVVVRDASATLLHNTLRGSPCVEPGLVPCPAPSEGRALQVLNPSGGRDHTVIVANNLLDAGEAELTVVLTSYLVQSAGGGVTELGLDVLQRNVWWAAPTGVPPHEYAGCLIASPTAGPPECIDLPVELAAALDPFDFDGAILPRDVTVFCPDRYHLSPDNSAAAVGVVDAADPGYRRETDIDGEARGVEADVGADEIGPCPPW